MCIILVAISTYPVSVSANVTLDNISVEEEYSVQGDINNLFLTISNLEIQTNNIANTEENVEIDITVENENTDLKIEEKFEYDTDENNIIEDSKIEIPLISEDRFAESDFPQEKTTKLDINIELNHRDVGSKEIAKETYITVLDSPKTCSEFKENSPNAPSGEYIIENNNNETNVYCLFNTDGEYVEDTYTFKYVENGIETESKNDYNTCKKYGLQLFTPQSPDEYDIALDYVDNTYGKSPSEWTSYSTSGDNGGLGPMGLYYPETFIGSESDFDSDESQFTHKNLHSTHYGDNSIDEDEYGEGGWRTISDKDRFWLSDGIVDDSEPNGDYVPESWLGFSWDNNGQIVNFNDHDDMYSYSSYLCTQKY